MDTGKLREIGRDIAAHAYLDCHPVWADDLFEAADTIERQAKQISNLKKAFADDQDVLGGLLQERDAALAEVERLKAELLEARRDCMGDLEKRYQWGML